MKNTKRTVNTSRKPFQVVRPQCKDCKKHYPAREISLGLCGDCWQLRINETNTLNELGNYVHRCFECNQPIEVGYYQFDRTANSFVIFCTKHSKRKIQIQVPYFGGK